MHLIAGNAHIITFAMGRMYFILTDGKLSRRENTLLFENKNTRKVIPIEDVDEIFVLSDLSITSKMLKLIADNGTILHLFNRFGFYVGSFYPRSKNESGHLIIKQAEHYIDQQKRLFLAKSFVAGGIQNLSYIYKLDPEIHLKRLKRAENIAEIMSVESDFRKRCYQELENITGLEFEKRSKRPPSNELNALISFGNSLVYAKVLGEIYFTPLNPTISYLHEPSTKRFSLSLDIAEIFKPIFTDWLIIHLFRKGRLTEKYFKKMDDLTLLNETGKKIFLKEFDDLLQGTVKYRKLKRKVSRRQLIRIELYKLVKHLIGDETYIPMNYRSLA